MQPFRKQKVNLMDMLSERSVAGFVVGYVISRPKSFAGIQGNVGGSAIRFASRRVGRLGAAWDRRVLLQRAIVVLLIGEKQPGQMLTAQDVEDESCEDQRGDDSGHVENATEALPSGSLGV